MSFVILCFFMLFLPSSWSSVPNNIFTRIISGESVPQNRYPYLVSLRYSLTGAHGCGGTLIAPDIVLTAAHCEGSKSVMIGLYRQSDIPYNNKYEEFQIREEIIHPLRRSINTYDHDVMLLILEGRSSYPTIRINSLPSIPETNANLQVIGWGRQDINAEKVSDDLRRVNVTYFDNTYCKNTIDFTDDMMCAKGYNQSGPCKGDSGGPLILSGNSSNMDLQLGIFSFAPVECTHPLYAGNYARISAVYPWIRNIICVYSKISPKEFECPAPSTQQTPIPTFGYVGSKDSRSPSISPLPTISYIPVLLKIKVDADPYDVKWHIQEGNDTKNVVTMQNSGGYVSPYCTYFEEITSLQPDREYTLILYDTCPGGMNGYVTIFLGTKEDDNNVLAFVDLYDKNSFDKLAIKFITSVNVTGSLPSATPSQTPTIEPSQPSISPYPTYVSTLIMVRFRTYVDSRTTGWNIVDSFGAILHKEPTGFFRGHEPVFLQSLEVNEGETYRLVITDSIGLGFSGEASIYLGNLLDDSTLIAFYDGSLGKKFYQYSINFTASLDAKVLPFPTLSPSLSKSSQGPIGNQVEVLILVQTDSTPLETAWKLTTLSGRVISQVPFGSFQKSSITYRSIVDLTNNQVYVLTIMDKLGNGLQGNVSIYLGTEVQSSKLLATFNQPEEAFLEKNLTLQVFASNYPSFTPNHYNISKINATLGITQPNTGSNASNPSSTSSTISEPPEVENDDSNFWDSINITASQDSSIHSQISIFSFTCIMFGFLPPLSLTMLLIF